ncbi:MAG: methylcobalamin:coenzyme methyltransferase [Acidobacteria bacterium]|nr:methylcobalamin:coenzyme methyltransferase [Acidobacteriota bacterium]
MSLPTSRELLLSAISCQTPSRVPCCLMSFRIMRDRCRDWYEVAEREKEMGLDPMLFVPPAERHERPEHPELRGLPIRFRPEVITREWKNQPADAPYPLLHKSYETPAGVLSTVVRQTGDWPHGDHIPFVDDYQIARAERNLVTATQDLEALRYLLVPPAAEDIAAFRRQAEEARRFTQKRGMLTSGGWGVGADMVGWLCGLENMVYLAADSPEFLEALFEMIGAWNRERMAVILESGVDLYIRRGWYESCQFWSPALYRRFILPHLKREARMAHEAGCKFGYIMTMSTRPLLDMFVEAGIDVLIGIDPSPAAQNDLPLMKEKFRGKICIWGGIDAAHTIELGTAEEVRRETEKALHLLGPDGFVLSPVDNITVDTPQTWSNLRVMIRTWQEFSRGGS